MITRQEVYEAIDTERDYQDKQWNGHTHEVGAYLTLLRTYLREAEESWSRSDGDRAALHSIRKIAAIAVHTMEEHGAPIREKQYKSV